VLDRNGIDDEVEGRAARASAVSSEETSSASAPSASASASLLFERLVTVTCAP
jgi:hypothetical protein